MAAGHDSDVLLSNSGWVVHELCLWELRINGWPKNNMKYLGISEGKLRNAPALCVWEDLPFDISQHSLEASLSGSSFWSRCNPDLKISSSLNLNTRRMLAFCQQKKDPIYKCFQQDLFLNSSETFFSLFFLPELSNFFLTYFPLSRFIFSFNALIFSYLVFNSY